LRGHTPSRCSPKSCPPPLGRGTLSPVFLPTHRREIMAKAKKAKTEEKPVATPTDPLKVHELLGLPAPYDPPKPPPDWPGYLTFWDPGKSILDLRQRLRSLFYPMEWYEKLEFARATDLAQWRQVRLAPIEPGKAYPEQLVKLPKGDEV